jgi:hypothetical protein
MIEMVNGGDQEILDFLPIYFLHFHEQVVAMGKLEIRLISAFVSNPMLF